MRREPGKCRGLKEFHLKELVHSFVIRLKVHITYINSGLLFLALVPTIPPILEALLAGAAQISAITVKQEKSCKNLSSYICSLA